MIENKNTEFNCTADSGCYSQYIKTYLNGYEVDLWKNYWKKQ